VIAQEFLVGLEKVRELFYCKLFSEKTLRNWKEIPYLSISFLLNRGCLNGSLALSYRLRPV